MQDEIDQKTVAFSVSTTKFTGNTLFKLAQYFAKKSIELEQEVKSPPIKHGKQSVKRLGKQNDGMTSVKISTENIKCFEKHARKYGVDFALKKDSNVDPPKYTIFFKAKENDSIQYALQDFSKEMMNKSKKPSVSQQVKQINQQQKVKKVTKQLNKQLNKNLAKSSRGMLP